MVEERLGGYSDYEKTEDIKCGSSRSEVNGFFEKCLKVQK